MIGSALVERLVVLGAVVTVADNLWRGRIENLINDDKSLIDLDQNFLRVDLRDWDNCMKAAAGQDIVYHLADVVTGIDYVFGNQFSLFGANVVMNSNVIHSSIASGVQKFVYVGTACSYPYDKQNKLNCKPFREEDMYPANPESSYGWSKLMGEYECELAQKEGLIDIGILRFHNVYGPKCDMSPERSQVIPALIRKALCYPDKEFVVWGSGKQRRDFVYLEDAVDALISVVERGMGKGVIQVGTGESISIREIAEYIIKVAAKDISIRFDTSKREGDVDRCADWSKAKNILDWAPYTDIQTGLRKTYDWCREYYSKVIQGGTRR